MSPRHGPWVLAAFASTLAGCLSMGQLQTARTTPNGSTVLTLSGGVLHNEMVPQRGMTVGNIPLQVGARHGLTDQLDFGVSTFMAPGLLADLKKNLMGPQNPFALSLQAGAAAAYYGDWTVHVPAGVSASYEVTGWLTPYAGAGYGAFWVFRPQKRPPPEGLTYAARRWHGDGLLLLRGGLQLRPSESFAVQLEYGRMVPVVDDPGDGFSFVTNQLFLAGFSVSL